MVAFSKNSFEIDTPFTKSYGAITIQEAGSPVVCVEILRADDWQLLDRDEGYREYRKVIEIGKKMAASHNKLVDQLEVAKEVISSMAGHITALERKLHEGENE